MLRNIVLVLDFVPHHWMEVVSILLCWHSVLLETPIWRSVLVLHKGVLTSSAGTSPTWLVPTHSSYLQLYRTMLEKRQNAMECSIIVVLNSQLLNAYTFGQTGPTQSSLRQTYWSHELVNLHSLMLFVHPIAAWMSLTVFLIFCPSPRK